EEIIDVVIPPEILPPELVYTGDLTGTYSDPAYLEAKLTDTLTGLPIEGRLLVFTLGPLTFDAVTDASGIASYVLLLDLPSDTYSLTISFAGDDSYTETSVTHDFFVAKEYAHADYTGRTVLPTSDDSFTLMATIFDDADGYWGNLTHIYVTFLVYFDSELVLEIGPVMVETTGVEGVGIAIAVTENLDEGDYIVVIHFESLDNSYYCGPDTEAGVTIYVPEREFVHGAGFIRDEDGHRVFFVFHAKYSCKGRLKGFLLLTYLEDDWVYVIQSTEILGLNVDGNHGIIEGSVRIAKFNLKTFEKDCSREEFSFRIDAWDNKNSDEYEDDVFQIRIHNSVGLVKYEVGFEPLGLLVRGNIKVKEHPHRHK
ncbi:MAG: Ig-like domain-containing protein, partial [Candidatus Thorarchaeota archaeon]